MKRNRNVLNSLLRQLTELWTSIEGDENLKVLARFIFLGLFVVTIVLLANLVPVFEDVLFPPVPPTATPVATFTPTLGPTSTPGPSLTPEPTLIPTPTQVPPPPLIRLPQWGHIRYLVIPLGAFIIIILASARFIQDVYALKQFRPALKYVNASMFGMSYPGLLIQEGSEQIREGEFNSIHDIGGPGYVTIQPGNAVIFRDLRSPSRVGITNSVFLRAFETIGMIANLDDQHNHQDEIEAVTKDGIQIKLQDINYRFRIISTKHRTLENPYPFDLEALNKMAYNRAVTAKGQLDWRSNVHNLVKSLLGDYINAHTLDFLTAPRQEGQDPRREMREFMLNRANTQPLQGIGADLLWIDVGHIDIVFPEVDAEREKFWATEWVGDAEIKRAYGEAKSQAYREIGRAEAQAELIMSITSSISESNFSQNPKDNLQNLFLARLAQVLDALKEERPD
jgi:hypothetical protein